MSDAIRVRMATLDDAPAWAAMRRALWPDESGIDTHESLMHALERGGAAAVFLAEQDRGAAVGFAEATLRHDYVNGTESSPVGFLEGWYVVPAWRSRGVGRMLIAAVEAWTRAQGCTELASDALLDNINSHAAHVCCGFEETERVVCFRKKLA